MRVNKAGTGSGMVTSNPDGITCGADCAEWYNEDTPVTLTAIPDKGFLFVGWSGDDDCSDGQVTMDADKTCTATFDLVPPVGGVTAPVDSLELLAPATGLLAALVALATSGITLVKRRRDQH